MTFLEIFLVAVGLSMDAFAVAICKGLAMPQVNKKQTLLIGAYFGVFQALMPLIGYLLGVNPFDQPGVEAYKKNMFALLGKPGYEARRAELEERMK